MANHSGNYGKILPSLPPTSDYLVGGMLKDKRDDFELWYAQNSHNPFDLAKEIHIYGKQDVILLTHALIRYRELVRIESGNSFECILSSSTTLASSCLRDWRMSSLEPETIPITPHGSYSRFDRQSRFAIRYLEWYSRLYGQKIQHANAGGEKK